MAAPSLNKQPVFTSTPFLWTQTHDFDINTSSYDLEGWISSSTNPTVEFTEATLIERITISATGDITNSTVSAKLVYICIYSAATAKWCLYKTLAMPATTVSHTTPNPQLEIAPDGGILFNSGDILRFAVSANWGSTSEYGDELAVTVEGGTYAVV